MRRLIAEPEHAARLHRVPAGGPDARFSTRRPTNLIMAIGAGEHLRLHGARGAVRELRPADHHHARCCRCRCRSRCSRSGRPAGRSICGARSASCCSSASSRRTRSCRSTTPTSCARAACRCDEAIVEACRTRLRPILMTTVGDHRRAGPDGARPRHRRRAAVGDCRHDHRRAVALPVPDAAAGAGRLREVRRARAVDGEQEVQSAPEQDADRTMAPQLRPPQTSVQGP